MKTHWMGGALGLAVGLATLLPVVASGAGYSARYSAVISKGADDVRVVVNQFASAHGFKEFKDSTGASTGLYLSADKRLGLSLTMGNAGAGVRVMLAPSGPGIGGNAARQKVIDDLNALLQAQFVGHIKVE